MRYLDRLPKQDYSIGRGGVHVNILKPQIIVFSRHTHNRPGRMESVHTFIAGLP
jgi:hypothetical protein